MHSFYIRHPRRLLVPIAIAAIGAALAPAPQANAGADRYGGVWHPGEPTGVFVPLDAGFTWNDVLDYQTIWSDLRITDLEVVRLGCGWDQSDRFALQWEVGSWKDMLEYYYSRSEFEEALIAACSEGFELVDFEVYDSYCDGTVYIALYRENDSCGKEAWPVVDSDAPDNFEKLVAQYVEVGWSLVDFEAASPLQSIYPTMNPTEIVGVWYPRKAEQTFALSERYDFEATMSKAEGERTLVDMESFQEMPVIWDDPWKEGEITRMVAALWEVLPENTDEHEVGEVYTKFEDLIYLDEKKHLVDFEVHENTYDRRFQRVFDQYFTDDGGGYAATILQAGEEVADVAGGWAQQPNFPFGIPMTQYGVGPVASVTKFFTTLGVLRYAETQPDPNAWLDEPMIDHLPPDFTQFGAGVETVTLRQLLRQRTGLAVFSPMNDPIANPAGFRNDMKAWLQQPLANVNKPFVYQNVHFELLALLMDEVELPPIVPGSTPWHDWMNDQVFAPAGVGPLVCGHQSNDALSYSATGYIGGIIWAQSTYPCAGNGTGVAMFWASPRDMALVSAAVRSGAISLPVTGPQIYTQNLGLDPDNSTGPGGKIDSKNGGLCGFWHPSIPSGTETLLARHDDTDYDDDGMPDNPFEVGYLDFDVGIAVHRTASIALDCQGVRQHPMPMELLKEALTEPEAW